MSSWLWHTKALTDTAAIGQERNAVPNPPVWPHNTQAHVRLLQERENSGSYHVVPRTYTITPGNTQLAL